MTKKSAAKDDIAAVSDENSEIAVIALRDVVFFPSMVLPLFVGREKSILALEEATADDKKILLVAQKKATDDKPTAKDLYNVGTISTILQVLKLPDGTLKVLVEGVQRCTIEKYTKEEPYFIAKASVLETSSIDAREAEVLMRSLMEQCGQYVKLNKKIPPEMIGSLANIDDPTRLTDTIAAHIPLKIEEKQRILEISDIKKRIEYLMSLMEAELDLMNVEKRIRRNVKRQMEKSQREYYLNEQMKAIKKELGDMDSPEESDSLKDKIEAAGMPKEAKEKALKELQKLSSMPSHAADATPIRNYIDWMVTVPWKKRSKIRHDLVQAEKILEKEHYGLEKVKERILEYLAVQERVKKLKGAVLCLVGPPGVGKTSVAASIAHATNRKFVRMSLGGVRDEAEIRGHRRTYIGSMPGRILQKLAKCGVRNPLFLLDEIDKMAMDYRGDPASALLEVLDPEQNQTFNDHYLEVDYDLSDVMFVTTANSLNIPGPLLDRMEVIRLSGYTEDEKLNIAAKYLMPKQLDMNGLKSDEIKISDQVILDVIRYYTRESGVRNLDREISKICRKVVKEILLNKSKTKSKAKTASISINPKSLETYLGVKKYRFGVAEEEDRIGQVTGLAWTEVGGEILTIEAVATAGTGKTIRTGKLGDVMQESIQAALTVVRSRAKSLGIAENFYQKNDIHIHVPEGATPKDGPSAGISMCTALVSVLTAIPVAADIAMTGEITLRGEVLPIGGLKEKLLAARRAGIKRVIIPHENERDLKEIPKNITDKLEIYPVRWIEEVLELALTRRPLPAGKKKAKAIAVPKAYKGGSSKGSGAATV